MSRPPLWPLLLLALSALSTSCAGCFERCTVEGCEEGRICSLATNRCLAPEEVFGTPCAGPNECHRQVCLSLDSTSAICTGRCDLEAGPPCPESFGCLTVNDGTGGTVDVCVPVGDGPVGAACDDATDCVTGFCLPLSSGPFCSAPCDREGHNSCGAGNQGCATFQNSQGELFGFCVAGGDAAPGAACPGGMVDCDLASSDACLSNADNTFNLCAPACPGGEGDCAGLEGWCCTNIGDDTDPAPFCLPPELCQACVPNCVGRLCGDDGCGGSCGPCETGEVCTTEGACVACTPDCLGKACGDNGCGGTCGACDAGQVCQANQCVANCVPDCQDKVCGDNGCGGLCGTCTAPLACSAGACVDPALLLTSALVRDPLLSPSALWGISALTGAPPSIAPPLSYGQGPQAGGQQQLFCGNIGTCSDVPSLAAERAYQLEIGYSDGFSTLSCVATFTLHDGAPTTVSGGTCLQAAGGPFNAVEVSEGGAPAFSWAL